MSGFYILTTKLQLIFFVKFIVKRLEFPVLVSSSVNIPLKRIRGPRCFLLDWPNFTA